MLQHILHGRLLINESIEIEIPRIALVVGVRALFITADRSQRQLTHLFVDSSPILLQTLELKIPCVPVSFSVPDRCLRYVQRLLLVACAVLRNLLAEPSHVVSQLLQVQILKMSLFLLIHPFLNCNVSA